MGLASESGEKNHNNNDGHQHHHGSAKDLSSSSTDTSKDPKKESFDGDFIIISEFSEQVGPVHLYIIPEGAEGTFNVNSFVLKIMAVDFQNKSNDPQSYLKDSQVAMPEPSADAYTYVSTLLLRKITTSFSFSFSTSISFFNTHFPLSTSLIILIFNTIY